MSIVYPQQALQLIRHDIGVYQPDISDKLTNFTRRYTWKQKLHILQSQ